MYFVEVDKLEVVQNTVWWYLVYNTHSTLSLYTVYTTTVEIMKKKNYENNYYFHMNVRKFREISIFLCKYIIHEMYNVCIIS